MEIASFHKDPKRRSVRNYQVPEHKKLKRELKRKWKIVCFQMLLKAYVNEIDNALEKDKKVGEVLKKIIYKILF